MVEKVLKQLRSDVKFRMWILSDLQQSIPENARKCLVTAVDDYKRLEIPCERICYLGDAVEGKNLDYLQEMVQMQMDVFDELAVPVRYVMGNHDFDYFRSCQADSKEVVLPFYDKISNKSNWKAIQTKDSFYFIEEHQDFVAIYLSDHVDISGSWFTSHGSVHGDTKQYPYDIEEYKKLNRIIGGYDKPVITFSHYSFPGGNRPSDLFERLLPLPQNVRIHFYGHAHIGDAVWAGKDLFRKIACVDYHSIPQINVSSLENVRGDAIRSVFLEVYKDDSFGIYFRNHSKCKWEEFYLKD